MLQDRDELLLPAGMFVVVAPDQGRRAVDQAVAFSRVASQRFTVASVIVVAFLKVRFVGTQFMDLRSAPWGLRLAFDAWGLSVGSVVLYLAAWYQA